MTTILPAVGERFIVGLTGTELTTDERSALKKLSPGGIILRAPNIEQAHAYEAWHSKLRALLQSAHEATGRAKLIVAIDHEGGRVHRVPAPLTHFPAAASWPARAREVGAIMAQELRSLGVNLLFGPVADIHSNPQNPVIGTRAFGSSPEAVTVAAIAHAQALQRGGIVPVAKHFPGHGDTHQDSHEELPRLSLTLAELRARELVPFEALVRAGIPAILTAHILFQAIDARRPATLSPIFLRTILRQEWGFKGLTISDDLDMKAILTTVQDNDVAALTFPAGLDLLLFNHSLPRAVRIAEILTLLLGSSAPVRASFEEGGARVEHFFNDILTQSSSELLSAETFATHAKAWQHISSGT